MNTNQAPIPTTVTVDAKALKNVLKQIKPAVAKRSNVPILRHVRLEAVGDSLQLSATDLMLSCVIKIPAKVTGDLLGVVSFTLFSQCISNARGDIGLGMTPTIQDSCGMLTVVHGRNAATIDTLPAEEWPVVPNAIGDYQSFDELPAILGDIKRACGIDESRAILTGIWLTDRRAYATDTHRLHVRDFKRHKGLDLILAPELVNNLATMIGKTEHISFRRSSYTSWVKTDNVEIACRLIEGQYPNAEKVIPTKGTLKWRFSLRPQDLAEALWSLAWTAKENSNRITIQLDGDGGATLRAESFVGKAEAKIDVVESDAAEFLPMAFSYAYLLDAVNMLWESDAIEFGGHGQQNQLIISAPDAKCFAIVMPMQIDAAMYPSKSRGEEIYEDARAKAAIA